MNKEYGTYIILPKYTYEDVKGDFVMRQLDWVKVKGKNKPIKIYELMGDKGSENGLREASEIFEAGLNSYMERDWDRAERCFQDVLKLRKDDAPSKVFINRVEMLRKTELPPDWDGVFVMTKK